MNRNLLLIDDKEEFKDDFKLMAQVKGFRLSWGKSLESLQEKLPKIHDNIVAVILDIKCLINGEQEIERADFIGAALTYLNQEYPELPRPILTGDEKALEAIKLFFNQETEDVYKKDPKDIERLFEKLEEHVANFPDRILKSEERELNELIAQKENKCLEFKSSLQFCTKENVKKKSLKFEVLKNITGFSNSNGGTVLIGVTDDGNIIGLENTDYITLKESNKEDGYRLLIDALIQENFGNGFQSNIEDLKFYRVKDKTVCKLTVKGRYLEPVFIDKKPDGGKKYEAFFIRGMASARELKGEEIKRHIKSSW